MIKSAGIYYGNEHRNNEHKLSGDGYEMNFSYLMSLASYIFAFVSSLWSIFTGCLELIQDIKNYI